MVNDLELARWLYGNNQIEVNTQRLTAGRTRTYTGIALSDSTSGSVIVDMGGNNVSPDGGQGVEVPCIPSVTKGDRVYITVVNGSPYVSGVIGWGDSLTEAVIADITYEWAASYSTTEAPVDGWTSTQPAQSNDNVLWRRAIATHADGSITIGDPEVASAPAGRDAVSITIVSSAGTAFKNSAVNTVLEVSIFKGGSRIENINDLHSTFGVAAYLQWSWKPLGSDNYSIISNNDSRLSRNGFALTLTPEDIDTQAVFNVDLMY